MLCEYRYKYNYANLAGIISDNSIVIEDDMWSPTYEDIVGTILPMLSEYMSASGNKVAQRKKKDILFFIFWCIEYDKFDEDTLRAVEFHLKKLDIIY